MIFFFFNDTATTEIYTLSLHDALPILIARVIFFLSLSIIGKTTVVPLRDENPIKITPYVTYTLIVVNILILDRKSTRLNSSHANISYAVFCLKKKTQNHLQLCTQLIDK